MYRLEQGSASYGLRAKSILLVFKDPPMKSTQNRVQRAQCAMLVRMPSQACLYDSTTALAPANLPHGKLALTSERLLTPGLEYQQKV